MPNGKIHDNPISNIIIHGLHPFPDDIEKMVLELNSYNPEFLNILKWAPFDWESGKHLDEARTLLSGLIKNYGNPAKCEELVRKYKNDMGSDW